MLIRTEKLNFFQKTLLDFFRKSGRSELPWRKRNISAYEVWVSEVMLQQTQVARVVGYYRRLLKKFPTVEHLARASWTEFLPYYAGLGYYARGRNMLRTAQAVRERYAGRFPKTVTELEQLPGIGPYTARAIASFAYHVPTLAWDTNLKRVCGRFFLGSKTEIGQAEEEFFEKRLGARGRMLNAALMDFGSALCVARPKCANCPLRTKCVYFKERGARELKINQHRVQSERWKQGHRVIVFLHEQHQRYFSSQAKRFEPFVLPRGIISRRMIKDYFEQKFQLALAVRPPHRAVAINGETVLWVNAQILLGEHAFRAFPKTAVLEYTKGVKLD